MNEDISFRPGDHLLNRMTASGCSHNSFGMLRFDPQTHVYIYISPHIMWFEVWRCDMSDQRSDVLGVC